MFASLIGLLAADYQKPRTSRTYKPNGEREKARRRRQDACTQQLASHSPSIFDATGRGVVWPRHLGQKAWFGMRGLSGKVIVDDADWGYANAIASADPGGS